MIKVVFKDTFLQHLIDGAWQAGDFLGLGSVYRQDDPRVLYVRPLPDSYLVLKEQLESMEKEGALTFVEQSA
jgi:hypothetical protein